MRVLYWVLGILCGLVVIASFIMGFQGCSGGTAISGRTLKATTGYYMYWKDGVTDEEKQAEYEVYGVDNDEDYFKKQYEEWITKDVIVTYNFTFKDDGSFILKSGKDETATEEKGYYVQSKDLDTIYLYSDIACKEPIGFKIVYHNSSYCMYLEGNLDYVMYLILQ